MKQGQGLIQQQSTKLVMTNELRQAISLLQFSSIELLQFLQEQTTENPLLSIETPYVESSHGRVKKQDRDKNDLPIIQSTSITLHEYLQKQIGVLNLSLEEKRVLDYLIFSIDDSGYFVGDIEEISTMFSVPTTIIEELLGKIQECEPTGVGARSLQECLWLQLKSLTVRNRLAEEVVLHYLQPLADRKWKEISIDLSVSIEEIQAIFDFIQTLDPRPGSAFHQEETNYVVPDLILKKEADGLKLYINEQLIPVIKVDRTYETLITHKHDDTHHYIKEKLNQVQFIKRAYEQRLQTMRKVMEAIIEKQTDYFLHANAKLVPMTMKDIAHMINVHESTVSRTVNGKYVQTPKGVFELKYFFSSSIQTEQNEDASSKAVKEAIVAIIKEENKKKPLSDQQITVILKEKYSYTISRRTAAKYREQLGILSSSKRKRF